MLEIKSLNTKLKGYVVDGTHTVDLCFIIEVENILFKNDHPCLQRNIELHPILHIIAVNSTNETKVKQLSLYFNQNFNPSNLSIHLFMCSHTQLIQKPTQKHSSIPHYLSSL
jgi:hypothetical protein